MPSKASFVYSTLGRAYRSQGDYAKTIEHHTQDLAIAKEVGDRAGEGITYGNIGCVYHEQGDFANAIEYLAQDLAIAKEVGNRAGEGTANGNLGTCHMHLNKYVKPSPTAKHIMLWQPRCSLHTCSLTQRSTWVSPSSFASAQLARALPSHPIPPY